MDSMNQPAPATSPEESAAATAEDPYLWLEEIDSPRALAWVEEQNARTKRELGSGPEFEALYREALTVLNAKSRVPHVTFRGKYLYNLWRSEENPRGVYRRTTLESLRSGSPEWTTVLDIDALSRREGKPWVFGGMACLPPEHRRCLVSLSPGGGDAVEVRELDAETLTFVENGFFLPVAKSDVSWIDENTVFVGTDFGAGSLTESGYPRVVKVWKRGTPLAEAATLYEGSRASVAARARRLRTETGDIDLIFDSLSFWRTEVFEVTGLPAKEKGGSVARIQLVMPGGSPYGVQRLALPETADVIDGFRGRLVVRLQDDWAAGGRTLRAGSVILVEPSSLRESSASGAPAVEVLVEPSASQVVEEVEVTDAAILVSMLDNVRGRLYRFTPQSTRDAQRTTGFVWKRESIPFPENGSVSLMSADHETGDALVLFESFTTPPTLYHVARSGAAPQAVTAQEATFDASRFDVTQQWARSKDGTRIPYFVVAPKAMARDGRNPVHLWSYGGFRSSLTPSYSGSYEELYGAYGKLWLERGGVFVLANIRGGAEFGPAWHASVLKEKHERIFEDFEAVAEDLVRSGITAADRIGIEGRSNGGLLTLATMIRRPELYGAVVSGVPLADMERYPLLLAGASWIGEYGDPRIPEEWAYISRYSPYQNLRADAEYPPIFVYTSTRDDRVHPGHARKTVARLLEQGHQVWYYENTEGGHGGSSTNEQLAYRLALTYRHLWRAVGERRK